jgi:hypothetical protein
MKKYSDVFIKKKFKKTSYPNTYLVEKIIKSKKDKVFVKLGFNDKYNEWINKKDLL